MLKVQPRNLAFALLFIAVAAVVMVFGIWTLARGPGYEFATGKVVSISTVKAGRIVCVRDNDDNRTVCGEVAEQLPERLDSVKVGDCAYIKATRGAALDLKHRSCR